MDGCPFCSLKAEILVHNQHAICIPDRHPVSQGHYLVIPKAHVSSIFELEHSAYVSCFELLQEAKQRAEQDWRPDGFNVGINCGVAAGQTVLHAHIHLIPRYNGDVPNPRGGVRNVIPGKGDY